LLIEPQQWHKQHVQLISPYFARSDMLVFGDAISVQDPSRPISKPNKPELSLTSTGHDGQVTIDPHARRLMEQRQYVNLTPGRDVKADPAFA